MNISGKTKVCALIGDPVAHSLSPHIQNVAFRHLDLDYTYVAFAVSSANLGAAIQGAKSLGLHGLNLTMPHKTKVIQFLDELDGVAKEISSVNTILNRNGKMIGYTTDGMGTLNALRHEGVNPSGKKIAVLGAGGASRSVSFIIARQASELVILNRTLEKAEALRTELCALLRQRTSVRAARLDEANLGHELRDTDILINATSVGMHPKETETPVRQGLISPGMVVFDLVYEPLETRLLKEAKGAGAKTISGLNMLVHQGAASFQIWTGRKAPIEVMMKAAVET